VLVHESNLYGLKEWVRKWFAKGEMRSIWQVSRNGRKRRRGSRRDAKNAEEWRKEEWFTLRRRERGGYGAKKNGSRYDAKNAEEWRKEEWFSRRRRECGGVAQRRMAHAETQRTQGV
jgi:hypothetical protein